MKEWISKIMNRERPVLGIIRAEVGGDQIGYNVNMQLGNPEGERSLTPYTGSPTRQGQILEGGTINSRAVEAAGRDPVNVVAAGYAANRSFAETAAKIEEIKAPAERARALISLSAGLYYGGRNNDLELRLAYTTAMQEKSRVSEDEYGRSLVGTTTYFQGSEGVSLMLLSIANLHILRGNGETAITVVHELHNNILSYTEGVELPEQPQGNAGQSQWSDRAKVYLPRQVAQARDLASLGIFVNNHPEASAVEAAEIAREIEAIVFSPAYIKNLPAATQSENLTRLAKLQLSIGDLDGVERTRKRLLELPEDDRKIYPGGGNVDPAKVTAAQIEAAAMVAAFQARVAEAYPVERLTGSQIQEILGSGNADAIAALGYNLTEGQLQSLLEAGTLSSAAEDDILRGFEQKAIEQEQASRQKRLLISDRRQRLKSEKDE